MIGRGLDGSGIAYFMSGSPQLQAHAGSGAAIDLSDYVHGIGTLIVAAGSVSTGMEAHVLRSGTSNGTFQGFGASIALNAGSVLFSRSFTIDTSAVWHRVYYTNGTGSMNAAQLLVVQGAHDVPITQPTGTTVWSTIDA